MRDEINDLKNSRVVIESKLDQLTGHIKQFISSIGGASLEQADSASSTIILIMIPFNTFPISNSFNISSFNVNGLKMYGQTKIKQISSFFSFKHISFGGVVNTYLHLKQIKFLSKRISNYTVFSSDLDTSKQILSSGGVSLFIDNVLALHVQDFISHSSHLLSVDLYFKGSVKLRIFVIYIPPPAERALRSDTIELLIHQLICLW
ncbi:hypothetical protein RhiirC2_788825 [Rhizophagus irregularis]|uniref:Uncharacterized protein n=1 Tax=Rhizophagus irregularis TaxID=588596 RepID=A0A2N1MPF4_9GLOM|nr:hypothetical protein RhiirC2_788825 [Rhizophagus irregularis]